MPTETASARNVLDRLDQNVPTRFYWSLTLLATLGGFLFGYDTSNIGAALDFLPYKLGDFATGYLVAGASLGAAAGALLAGPLTDRFGRKVLLIIDALIYAIGALLAAFTPNVAVLLVARTLIGLAIGADSAIATAYIAEYAPRKRRGALVMLQQWMITVGILVSYLIALVILKLWPGSATTVDWRLFFGLGAVPAVIGLILRFEMPESPRWLMRQHRYDDTRAAFGKLGIDASTDDIEYTARELERTDRAQERQRRRGWTPGVRRALMIVCGFFVFQQITGINVPLYYGPQLLGQYFQSGSDQVAVTTAGIEVTAIMTAVNVAATFLAFKYIDRIGRRKLALGGFAGMAVAAVIAAIGIGAMTATPRLVVAMIGLDLFIACFAIGVGGTGWLIQGETFPAWRRAIGVHWVLVCFAALCVMAVVFVGRYLPETKGLSVEEVTELYEKQAAGDVASGSTAKRPRRGHRPALGH
jgi:SP family arabinose:H+ symporter-like MFS transporter